MTDYTHDFNDTYLAALEEILQHLADGMITVEEAKNKICLLNS